MRRGETIKSSKKTYIQWPTIWSKYCDSSVGLSKSLKSWCLWIYIGASWHKHDKKTRQCLFSSTFWPRLPIILTYDHDHHYDHQSSSPSSFLSFISELSVEQQLYLNPLCDSNQIRFAFKLIRTKTGVNFILRCLSSERVRIMLFHLLLLGILVLQEIECCKKSLTRNELTKIIAPGKGSLILKLFLLSSLKKMQVMVWRIVPGGAGRSLGTLN